MKAIKASMHEAVRAQKPVLTMIQSLTKWLTLKQNDGMNLSMYAKQFTEQRDVVKAQLGPQIFDYFVEQQAEYRSVKDDVAKQKLKNAMFDEFTGILFLLNRDQRKYGSIATELAGAYTRGRDEYPKNLLFMDFLPSLTRFWYLCDGLNAYNPSGVRSNFTTPLLVCTWNASSFAES